MSRSWVHAHEHDADGCAVYVPDGVPMPPARGRQTLDLSANGTARAGRPGPTDRREWSDGTWRLEGDQLVVSAGDQIGQRFDVVSVDDQQLVLRPTMNQRSEQEEPNANRDSND